MGAVEADRALPEKIELADEPENFADEPSDGHHFWTTAWRTHVSLRGGVMLN